MMLGRERNCWQCNKDDAVTTLAVVVYNGTSLCRKHADAAQEEVEALDQLFALDWDEGRPQPGGGVV